MKIFLTLDQNSTQSIVGQQTDPSLNYMDFKISESFTLRLKKFPVKLVIMSLLTSSLHIFSPCYHLYFLYFAPILTL